MTWIGRVGDTLDFMPIGTWGEWFGAAGSMVAAGGALWLLKREGDDRAELQQAERQRIEADRLQQASRVYVSFWHGVTYHDGSSELQDWNVRLVNGSAEVMTRAVLLYQTRIGAAPYKLAVPLKRVLPAEQFDYKVTFSGPDSKGLARSERDLLLGIRLVFDNSQGSWCIDVNHRLHSFTPDERRKLLSEYRTREGVRPR